MQRANQDRAADFWRDLGFDFAEIDSWRGTLKKVL
jgi:hypothetical protein